MFMEERGHGTAPGDPHRALVETVRSKGPSVLAALLGDQGFALRELALHPRDLFTPGAEFGDDFTDVVGMIHELRSAMDALEARAVVALTDSLFLHKRAEAEARVAQETEDVPSERTLLRDARQEAVHEVSMRIRKSPASAAHSLASQRRLVEDMPEMLTALASAQVTSTVAHRTSRSFGVLSPAGRAHADRLLGARLPDLDGAGAETWDDAASAAIAEADPYGQGRRHQRAKQERHVTVRRAEHGMATVTARISALDGARIRKRLSLEAERLRAAGDRRGHQAIQADSFVDTLLGQEDGMVATTLDIGIMVTERALIHPGAGDLAQIEGYGTAPAEVLREELRGPLGIALTQETDEAMGPDGPALHATMRRLYTHPRTGELVAVESRARAFPAALAKFIRWRDQICRAPFCDAAIRQIDHIQTHASGGGTCLDNGQGLCARCNAKEQQARSVRRVQGSRKGDADTGGADTSGADTGGADTGGADTGGADTGGAGTGGAGADGHIVEWISPRGTRRTTRPRSLTTGDPATRRRRTLRRKRRPHAPPSPEAPV